MGGLGCGLLLSGFLAQHAPWPLKLPFLVRIALLMASFAVTYALPEAVTHRAPRPPLRLSDTWKRTCKPIRSHNEGINGHLKSEELDIGNPKHRPAPGVAQTLLTAMMIAVGNLGILETWLHVRTGSRLIDLDYESIPTPAPTQTEPPRGGCRPPPSGS